MGGQSREGGQVDRLDVICEGVDPEGVREGESTAPSAGPLQPVIQAILARWKQDPRPERYVDQGFSNEQEARGAACLEHLSAYGFGTDPVRLHALLEDTAPVPLTILEDSLRLTRQTHDSNYPPTSGQVIEMARIFSQSHHPRYTAGAELRQPTWYTLMKRPRYFDKRGPSDLQPIMEN